MLYYTIISENFRTKKMPFSVKKKMYSLLGKVTQKYINKYIYIYGWDGREMSFTSKTI